MEALVFVSGLALCLAIAFGLAAGALQLLFKALMPLKSPSPNDAPQFDKAVHYWSRVKRAA